MGANWNERLDSIQGSLSYLLPELLLTVLFLVLLLISFFRPRRGVLLALTGIGHLVCLTVVVMGGFHEDAILFDGMLRSDGLGAWFKVLIDASVILTCVLTPPARQERMGEYVVVLTAIALGAHLLVMASHFLIVFISLEIVSIGGYVLAGFAFNKAGSEGSIKYFLFGASAAAVMLYGFSWLYGVSGTLLFHDPAWTDTMTGTSSSLLVMAGLMVLAGFLYKISAAPMHFWAPDVYAAAPTAVIAFFSVAPKLAGLCVMIRFLPVLNVLETDVDWQTVLAILSLVTITIGNVAALRQNEPKRMMAYSSIAHAGFLLVGLVTFSHPGMMYLLFYSAVYLIMNFLVFALLIVFEERGVHTISSFAGMGTVYTWPSVILVAGFIALTGLPPTAGFTAKLFVFSALWESYGVTEKTALLWLLAGGLINTVIALFYYLRIPYFSFLKPPAPDVATPTKFFNSFLLHFVVILLVLALLALFFIPALLMGWINKITFAL